MKTKATRPSLHRGFLIFAAVWPYLSASAFVAVLFGFGRAALASNYDVMSVFRIEKSENRNQVHYGIHLDAGCVPAQEAPVFVYWRELERGPDVTLPLLALEHSAYGIDAQRIVERLPSAGRVSIRLRALPQREVLFESYRDGPRGCQARAVTRIDGQRAVLHSVYVKLGGLLSVEYIRLNGATLPGDRVVEEVVRR